MCRNIRSNSTYAIYTVKVGAGGALGTVKLSEFGRQNSGMEKKPRILGHDSKILAFDISPFDNTVATGSNDAKVYLWKIPDDLKGDMKNPSATLQHNDRQKVVRFNPVIPNILLTADFGSNDKSCLRVWDTEAEEEAFNIEFETEIMDLDFDSTGNRVVVSCSDRTVHVVDLIKKKSILNWKPDESKRDVVVRFCGDDRVITCGFVRGSVCRFSVWEIDGLMEKPLLIQEVGKSNAFPYVHVDPYTKLVYIVGQGERRIKTYEVF
eukprot:UN06566